MCCHRKLIGWTALATVLFLFAQDSRAQNPTTQVAPTYVLVANQTVATGAVCPTCYATAHYGYRTARRGLRVPAVEWLLDDRTIILAPDYGWSYVVKRPIHRSNVAYQRYWPAAWGGSGAAQAGDQKVRSYPMVAVPTDTTQLGYYYQQAPQWQPRPAMLPKPPVPSQWHVRKCAPGLDGSYTVWVPLSRIQPSASPASSPQQAEPQKTPPPEPTPVESPKAQSETDQSSKQAALFQPNMQPVSARSN